MRKQVESRNENVHTVGLPLADLSHVLEADDPNEAYAWAVDLLSERTPAEVVEIAIAREARLVPTVRSDHAHTGRDHALPIATSIAGSVFTSGNGCVIGDLDDVRGGGVTASAQQATGPRPRPAHRSMVCVPLEDVGVILLLAREPNAFTEDHLHETEEIARLVGQIANLLGTSSSMHQEGTEQLLEEIGNMVSHDLRNKINIATGRLDLAMKTGEAEHFQRCSDALESVESIANVVVSLARTGDPLDELTDVDLRETAKMAFGPFEDPDAKLSTKATATILADEGCLAQLFENLFRNAIEHCDGPVDIEVGLLEDGFYVSDDGPGIPPEIRDEVCQLGYSTAGEHKGKGLTIVSRMANAHGWSLSLTESLSGGTRVEVRDVVFH